jgi:hypothetical protein
MVSEGIKMMREEQDLLKRTPPHTSSSSRIFCENFGGSVGRRILSSNYTYPTETIILRLACRATCLSTQQEASLAGLCLSG